MRNIAKVGWLILIVASLFVPTVGLGHAGRWPLSVFIFFVVLDVFEYFRAFHTVPILAIAFLLAFVAISRRAAELFFGVAGLVLVWMAAVLSLDIVDQWMKLIPLAICTGAFVAYALWWPTSRPESLDIDERT